jgi:hypothetical protein
VETESCTGSSGAGAGTSPFSGLRMSLAVVGVNLQVSGSSHYFASVRLRFRRSFADHIVAPADRTAGEVLEPAHFRGPIPFPPSPPSFGVAGLTAGSKLTFHVRCQRRARQLEIRTSLMWLLSPDVERLWSSTIRWFAFVRFPQLFP